MIYENLVKDLAIGEHMTVDQKIQIWNAIGTWIAGFATFTAVVLSLYLARRSEKVRLKVHAGLRVIFVGDGSPPDEHLQIDVTNLADRPITINSIGWAVGKGKKRKLCVQPVASRFSSEYPLELTHGKSANFMVSFNNTPTWLTDFANKFIESSDDALLRTLVAQVHTSLGKTIEVKPEKGLIDRLKRAYNG